MVAATVLLGVLGDVSAQESRYLAGACTSCHGTDGHPVLAGTMPALAGMARADFVERFNALRNGTQPSTIMHQIARGFSDEQIALLAEFFWRQAR